MKLLTDTAANRPLPTAIDGVCMANLSRAQLDDLQALAREADESGEAGEEFNADGEHSQRFLLHLFAAPVLVAPDGTAFEDVQTIEDVRALPPTVANRLVEALLETMEVAAGKS